MAIVKSGKGNFHKHKMKPSKVLKKYYQLYIFLLPAIICYLLFYYFPMVGVIIAFKDFSPIDGIFGSPWLENPFSNFQRFFTSYQFKQLMSNTVILSMMQLFCNFSDANNTCSCNKPESF